MEIVGDLLVKSKKKKKVEGGLTRLGAAGRKGEKEGRRKEAGIHLCAECLSCERPSCVWDAG